MHVCIFESLQLEASYVGDLLYGLWSQNALGSNLNHEVVLHRSNKLTTKSQ